jgi:hypothetical protein
VTIDADVAIIEGFRSIDTRGSAKMVQFTNKMGDFGSAPEDPPSHPSDSVVFCDFTAMLMRIGIGENGTSTGPFCSVHSVLNIRG